MSTLASPLWFVDFVCDYEVIKNSNKNLVFYRSYEKEGIRTIIINHQRFDVSFENAERRVIYESQLLAPTNPRRCNKYEVAKFYLFSGELEDYNHHNLQIYSKFLLAVDDIIYYSQNRNWVPNSISMVTHMTIVAKVPFNLIYNTEYKNIIKSSKLCAYDAKSNMRIEKKGR